MGIKDENNMYMYELVCKPAFERIEKTLDRMEKKLIGDGKNGVCDRLTMAETEIKNQRSRWKWLIGASTALTVTVLAKMVYELIRSL